MSKQEYFDECKKRFGDDPMQWRFVCPSCKTEMSTQDYKDAGAPESAVAFSCVGRWNGSKRQMGEDGTGPCNYAGGGLFRLNPVDVDGERYFAIAGT